MHFYRSLILLAIFIAIVPFLAVPDWLSEILIVASALLLFTLTIISRRRSMKARQPQSNNKPTPKNSNDSESTSRTKESKQHPNITDPKKENFIAMDSWQDQARDNNS